MNNNDKRVQVGQIPVLPEEYGLRMQKKILKELRSIQSQAGRLKIELTGLRMHYPELFTNELMDAIETVDGYLSESHRQRSNSLPFPSDDPQQPKLIDVTDNEF